MRALRTSVAVLAALVATVTAGEATEAQALTLHGGSPEDARLALSVGRTF